MWLLDHLLGPAAVIIIVVYVLVTLQRIPPPRPKRRPRGSHPDAPEYRDERKRV